MAVASAVAFAALVLPVRTWAGDAGDAGAGRASGGGALTPGQIVCMKVDKTPEEEAACLCGGGGGGGGGSDETVARRPGCHACVVGAPAGAPRTPAIASAVAVALAAMVGGRRARRAR